MSVPARKEEEEKVDPLIEYFYIIGPNPETIKSDEFYNNFSPNLNELNAKIISKFPPYERPLSSIKEEIIISHCFPNGYNIEESNPGRKIFHFSLQNIFPQPSGEGKIYYTCVKFYEPLSKYYDIKQRQSYSFISDKNIEEFSNQFQNFGKLKRQSVILKENPVFFLQKKKLFEKYFIPKVICFCSLAPFPYEFGFLLNKIINYTISTNNENINNKEEIKDKNIDKDKQNNEKDKQNNNDKDKDKPKNNENNNDKDKPKNNDNNNDNKINIPIDKIIETIIMNVPMPMRGIFRVNFKNNNVFFKNNEKDFLIQQKLINKYYCPTHIIQSIFVFNSNDIIEIYKSLLLEIPILFFSKDIEKLTNIFESFISLLYPLQYQYPHVSILPDINSAIIQNFEIFAFGINQEWIMEKKIDKEKQTDEKEKEANEKIKEKKDYFERNNIKIINKAILICDIDNSKIEIYFNKLENEHIVYFKDLGKNININTNININSSKNINHENKYESTKYALPAHYIDKVKKKLENFKNANKNMKLNEYNEEYNKKIAEDIFFYFLISILTKYNNYLYNSESDIKNICQRIFINRKNENISYMFNAQKFINECKSSEINFYTALFKTQLFADFIKRKYFNKKKDKLIFLNFDENIIRKRNKSFLTKKYDTPFITHTIFDNSNDIEIFKYKNFNEEEKKYILENKKQLLDYYQTYNGKEFKYLIFPKLLYDNQFFKNKKEYILNYKYDFRASDFTKVYKDLVKEIIEQKQYYKIYTGDLIIQDKFNPSIFLYDNEIQNSVILLWLRMFCLTFYYCEKNEKNLRFYEMINMVKKLTYIKDDIFSLILSTLDKYGTEIMMIQFFSTLNNYNYIQYSYLSHKLIKKNNIKSELKTMNISNTSLTVNYYKEEDEEYIIPHINKDDIEKIKQRTFGVNNNSTQKDENIYFSHNIKCDGCGENLEISGLTLNYKGMLKTRYLICQCNKNLTNKITIKVNGKYFKITLYEPYYLYRIISTEILQNYGNKISLDELRIKYKDFYWNCIWYFGSQGLSYDMLLKYKDDLEKNKKKRKLKFDCLQISNNNTDNLTDIKK